MRRMQRDEIKQEAALEEKVIPRKDEVIMPEFLETTHDKFIFKVKTGYFYTEDDYWVDIKDAIATVGVTDYLQKSGGDVAFVEPGAPGKVVEKGDELGEIETIKTTMGLVSPVAGKISEINEKLAAQPELINNDPYGEGWIYRIELADPGNAARHFLQAGQYLEFIKGKLEKWSAV